MIPATQLCFIVDRIGYIEGGVTVLTLYTSKKLALIITWKKKNTTYTKLHNRR